MALSNFKLTEAAIRANGVVSAPDKLTGSAAENKKVFDNMFTAVMMSLMNGLIDELAGAAAASEIGAVSVDGNGSETTVQEALNWLRKTVDEIQAGAVADNSITAEKIAKGAVLYSKLDAALQGKMDAVRKITVSTAQPSGGADGDLWVVVS